MEAGLTRGRGLPKRVRERLRSEARVFRLLVRNHFVRSSLVDPSTACVVSLTSHGRRVRRVYVTIESIGRGDVLPSRIVLWLNDRDTVMHPPASLRRLAKRGLELRQAENFGPHTKYFPYVLENEAKAPLVTADDDVFYPRDWLSGLVGSHKDRPESVHCHRAHRVRLTEDGIAPYKTWGACRNTEPSLLNFPTGVSGTLYPPRLQVALKERGREFEQRCPRADDVWVHATCVAECITVQQVAAEPRDFPAIKGSFGSALMKLNVFDGGNDPQIRATYTAEELGRLRAAAAAC
jgi:hypothetical protein